LFEEKEPFIGPLDSDDDDDDDDERWGSCDNEDEEGKVIDGCGG
jgi:hypothetical protein